jgi:hypothetical protein
MPVLHHANQLLQARQTKDGKAGKAGCQPFVGGD